MEAMYKGEARFMGYTDSSSRGACVRLQLPDRDLLQSFIGNEGKRYMVALVEIGEDEKPADPRSKAVAHASILCKDDQFIKYCEMNHAGDMVDGDPKHVIYKACGIKSRSELKDTAKAELFKSKIAQPFYEWKLMVENYE